jgi:NADH-quinone oxidoreductase subunit C
VAESTSAHPASTSPTQADTSQLNESSRELLALVGEVFQDLHPELGAVLDLPQVAIGPGAIVRACRLAKEDSRLGFERLLCLACVDYKEYFQLVYLLHSINRERTLVIKTNVPYDDPHLPSITSVWRAADWYEREAHDLFGVVFDGHPSLAPLLLYEGFEGYPGRKEFPFHDYQEF